MSHCDVPDFKLRAVLHGHSGDVRCIAIAKENYILSASRDKTTKLWIPDGNNGYVNSVTYTGHSSYVSSVCWLPPCEEFPDGLVVTGSNDKTIKCYNIEDPFPVKTLIGHEDTVCSVVAARKPGQIISGSWDKTARVWSLRNIGQSTSLILKGHQAAVWAAVELHNGTYATGSADKTISIYSDSGMRINNFTAHTDCVRGLATMQELAFLSCSNDGHIKLWGSDGELLGNFAAGCNYIYSISPGHGESGQWVVSGGEDGCARIWSAGRCQRILSHPVQSVWSVTWLPNGDIVTGSSDAIIRIFSSEPTRQFSAEQLKAYDAEIEKMVEASNQEIGGFKMHEIPGPESLLEPGSSEGQTRMVREGSSVRAYAWSNAEGWTLLGDVTGAAPPQQGKVMHKGKEYDYVFNVDIKDGAPPLKLPYLKSDDPWVAAQKFIHDNELPQTYLDQIANFIITNANLGNAPAPTGNGPVDPFTGGSRYVPGVTAQTTYKYIPHDAYVKFEAANIDGIFIKLKEFNARVNEAHNKLSEDELEIIYKLADIKHGPNTQGVNLLKKLFLWPKDLLFPVLDILRLCVRNKDNNEQAFGTENGGFFMDNLKQLILPGNLPANQMLALRVLANAFCDITGEMAVLTNADSIIAAIMLIQQGNNSMQVAAATLLLNLTVALLKQDEAVTLCDCILEYSKAINDSEAHFRTLVALGTLVADSKHINVIKDKVKANRAVVQRLEEFSKNVNSSHPVTNKVAVCSTEILTILKT